MRRLCDMIFWARLGPHDRMLQEVRISYLLVEEVQDIHELVRVGGALRCGFCAHRQSHDQVNRAVFGLQEVESSRSLEQQVCVD